ncbi:hypothetical protein Micbo1qcDRAFT_157829, partial [Microdochium bolleyi]
MLQQIEEYERELALKAELLRQEQERIVEEKRRRELEERIRQEQARRQEVVIKFRGLREAFEQIHEMQRSIIGNTHTQEDQELTAEHASKMETSKDRHETERENLLAST